MHITPSELRAAPRRDLTVRSARLGPVSAVLAELPVTGSEGTSLEHPCERAHWTVVLRGEIELLRGGERTELTTGHAFYVPAGKPAHTFRSGRRAVLAGFVPAPNDAGSLRGSLAVAANTLAEPSAGEIHAEALSAGPWIMTRSSFGPTSGYGAGWCDVPHWGVVVSGGGVIEYEDDVEVISAGDLYYCPAGPPAHKLEVADRATFVDFTPRDALEASTRVGEWRPLPALVAR